MSHGKIVPTKYKFKKNPDGSYQLLGGYKGKITGTTFAPIVGRSPWDTPFSAAAYILGLFKEDISDVPAVHTGVVLEPVILKHFRDQGVIPADEVYAERRGPHNGWKQDWDDEIFGGHVDGVTEDGNIVEVKTTSSPEDWLGGVPEHYWLQASLYAHFLGATKIKFLVGIVDSETYSNPYKWNPEGNTSVFDVDLHPKTEEYIGYCTEWYHKFIDNLATPVPDMSNEIDAYIVKALDAQMMTQDEMFEIVDRYSFVQSEIAKTDGLRKEADELKMQMSIFMEKNDLSFITGTTAAYKRQTSIRTIVDTDAMKRDGIYDKYTKKSESVSIRATRM